MFPLRVQSERFFTAVCEQAKLHLQGLLEATRGCGELEDSSRAQLKAAVVLSRQFKTLRAALADKGALHAVLCDAEQYGESLLDTWAVTSKKERENCREFVARCRAFRHEHLGLNIYERACKESDSVDVMDLLKRGRQNQMPRPQTGAM